MMPHAALDLAREIADRLAYPATSLGAAVAADWRRQSLGHGVPGIALLHIELAAAGLGPWDRADAWLAAATSGQPLTTGADSHAFYGAPAVAHALACAAERLPGAYGAVLDALDRQMVSDADRRLACAEQRIAAGQLPALAEFDAIRGLTGYGAYLLRRRPDSDTVRTVLDYLIQLTLPLDHQGETVPGWWTASGPSGRPDDRYPDGHGNTGVAHGIGGVLALLSLAARHGTMAAGHREAIRSILSWLDRWQVDTGRGPVWPYWVTLPALRTGDLALGPQRPSWCYGTAGLARAQQLAAIALGDRARQLAAERALLAALTDPNQLRTTTDNGLCHGFSGLAHIAARAAHDALPATAGRLRAVLPALLAPVHPPGSDAAAAATALLHTSEPDPGLLDGASGIALALLTPATGAPPHTSWDACLLIA
ncbi:lanthionine synthetase C family protein [Streptomyces sp. NPDC059176]|uniref:lanthionine synthetase C family protein n=1 Tax=Streptomyces sp. NPDC059176 TaxID=3346758 RepID=UPI0036944420